jgi:hypothetical protein
MRMCLTCLHDHARRSLTRVYARRLFTAGVRRFSQAHYAPAKIARLMRASNSNEEMSAPADIRTTMTIVMERIKHDMKTTTTAAASTLLLCEANSGPAD